MIRRIVPIVEGHSEADSIPAFLRRVLQDRGIYAYDTGRAIREHRNRLAKPEVFANRVRMAQMREGCAAVMAVFDSDDDAACVLGPSLLRETISSGVTVPLSIVLAVREVEAWLIAGVKSLRGYRGMVEDADTPEFPESIRGAKEWLSARMRNGYKPTIDQLPYLLRFDYQEARHLAPSLDKFLRDLDRIVNSTLH